VKPTRPPFKIWTLLKRLKSPLASNVVQTHQEISITIIARTTPTGSLAHNSLLNSSASRPKAERNATVLSINDVRPTDLVTITELSRLTPRAAANMVDCIGLQEFRTQGRFDGDCEDTCPIAGKTNAVSEKIGVREIGWDGLRLLPQHPAVWSCVAEATAGRSRRSPRTR